MYVYLSGGVVLFTETKSSQHEELIRTDVSDGMEGIPLTIDFGVMDVTTCTPLEDALVDICEALATFSHSLMLTIDQGIAMYAFSQCNFILLFIMNLLGYRCLFWFHRF